MPTLDTSRLRGRAVLRDPDEGHRAATNLELFFDLVFVVAVGRAAAALHHQLGAEHVGDALVGFATMFFALWWSWMNFTWFASAHDSDDVTHRLLTLLQMAGALVLAAGVTKAAEHGDFVIVTVGYAIARVGLVSSWLRVARDHPDERPRALRYALPLVGLQALWLLRLLVPDGLALASFVVLAVAELAIPVYAERAAGEGRARFHAGHIEERYGLFVIILLGETILSATAGFQEAFDAGGLTLDLAVIAVGGLVLAFGAWWLYFDHPGHLAPAPGRSFRWGYAHVVVFASLAAMGSGVALDAENLLPGGHHSSPRIAALAVAVPAATYLLGLVLVMLVNGLRLGQIRVWPKIVGAVLMLVLGATAGVVETAGGCAAVMLVLTAWMVLDADAPTPATELDPGA
ncbi:low temperature requirement protein A [Aquihabitans sp. G128]|uniref:low temperature requirement protein A n=1 Tax=Aquihabitans sp. G128 TaxID=2849779 RepID=UPI001C210E4E|nr:low temperature requirement protein A [Aquihabitans sp. G128]QXC61549.1 low temperature requirement protein A [Aquihabitans sp. G128]